MRRTTLSPIVLPRIVLPRIPLPRIPLSRIPLPRILLSRALLSPIFLLRARLPRIPLPRIVLPRVPLPRIALPRILLPRILLLCLLLPVLAGAAAGCDTIKHNWKPVKESARDERQGDRDTGNPTEAPGSAGRTASRGNAGGERTARAGVSSPPVYPALIKRGEYLVNVGSCHDCHTPHVFRADLRIQVPDFSRRLSGHPEYGLKPASSLRSPDAVIFGADMTSMRTPAGVVFAANLTPDKETGLGSIPLSMFIATMRTGLHLGSGRPILPPMPWPSLARASDEDLEAIYAYLQSLPPIRNRVPQPEVSPRVYEQLREAYSRLVQESPPAGPGS